MTNAEQAACIPESLNAHGFNPDAMLPYHLTNMHLQSAMEEFLDFLGFMNGQLYARAIPRLETFLMPAAFSGLVGEFMNQAIPKYCPSLVKNSHHNGHPDLIPKGLFANDSVQYTHEGIEVKGSRYKGGWQGHNPERGWLLVFHFEANSANESKGQFVPRSFRFVAVYAADLVLEDWTYSGRSETSRRTITASVNPHGMQKMRANWIYRASE
jgi:hypothetical protein